MGDIETRAQETIWTSLEWWGDDSTRMVAWAL